jgi:hypothetical protein
MASGNTAQTSQSVLNQVDLSQYSQELTENYQKLKQQLKKKHSQSHQWLEENFQSPKELSEFVQQMVAAVTLASHLVINQPVEAQVLRNFEAIEQKQDKDLLDQITRQEFEEIIQKMVGYVNMDVGHLPKEDELYLEQQLSDMLGFDVVAELEGNRLNHSIGIMGGEQHLKRYPGDTLQDHDAYQEAGIAPNRGAYGWFTEDGELTEKAIMMEKYYFAVQTLYLPDWNERHSELKPWYKFRKMIVINPAERLAAVGVVGDAGPAMWVKKQFGGSPEIIREAKIWSPAAKGRVILFFIDDPDDQVPLGIIDLDNLNTLIE